MRQWLDHPELSGIATEAVKRSSGSDYQIAREVLDAINAAGYLFEKVDPAYAEEKPLASYCIRCGGAFIGEHTCGRDRD